MRFYSVARIGIHKVRYREMRRSLEDKIPGVYESGTIRWNVPTHQEIIRTGTSEILSVPSTVPKVFDPFLLWKQTDRREPFRILEIQDKTGHTWFEIKSSTMPIAKIMEISSDILNEMR